MDNIYNCQCKDIYFSVELTDDDKEHLEVQFCPFCGELLDTDDDIDLGDLED